MSYNCKALHFFIILKEWLSRKTSYILEEFYKVDILDAYHSACVCVTICMGALLVVHDVDSRQRSSTDTIRWSANSSMSYGPN